MIITLLFVGLIVGSFLNVVIHRLPRMIDGIWEMETADGRKIPMKADFNLARPRSFCPVCRHRIEAFENIPLFSYLWLRGRCSGGGCRISPRYPLVELGGALIAVAAGWHFGFGIEALGACLLGWALLAGSAIDIETGLLPDTITLPLLWLGLVFNIGDTFTPLADAVIGAMLGYLSLRIIYHIFEMVTGKEGMGFGDFKLLAALGAWLGWQSLVGIVFLSSLIGGVIAGIIIFKRAPSSPPTEVSLPFGPCLALAGLHTLYIGDPFDLLIRSLGLHL
ncbi:prepilin peptidase [Thioalkalivibrio sp. HK1]|uniref:prepilin peptidase n=1 Tax=Thioalkalivibrio sp. HK1 TaxID=1469245 RepID=UPI00046E5960|nr:A24 family peptidase [Thioalkalivibrio sp. HK1]